MKAVEPRIANNVKEFLHLGIRKGIVDDVLFDDDLPGFQCVTKGLKVGCDVWILPRWRRLNSGRWLFNDHRQDNSYQSNQHSIHKEVATSIIVRDSQAYFV